MFKTSVHTVAIVIDVMYTYQLDYKRLQIIIEKPCLLAARVLGVVARGNDITKEYL